MSACNNRSTPMGIFCHIRQLSLSHCTAPTTSFQGEEGRIGSKFTGSCSFQLDKNYFLPTIRALYKHVSCYIVKTTARNAACQQLHIAHQSAFPKSISRCTHGMQILGTKIFPLYQTTLTAQKGPYLRR